MRIEVVYALPERQRLVELEVEQGCTVLMAAERSGLAEEFPELDWQGALFGVFGRVVEEPARETLREGDRVEIYRPLLIDPKAVRRQRAAKARS